MLIQTNKYNFHQAVEVMSLNITARTGHTFELSTEFGNILVQIDKDQLDEIYRYETKSWDRCPINSHTDYQIRRKDLDHYISIARVHEKSIQKLMVVMALSECLVRFITGNDYRTDRETTNFIAASYMRNADPLIGDMSPSTLADAYIKSVKPAGLFRPKSDSVTRSFMTSFFKRIMDDYGNERRKDENNSREKLRECNMEFGDAFFQEVFGHMYRNLHLPKATPESGQAALYREICSRDNESEIFSIPSAMRYIITGLK